ncbi:MAG: gliding motility-associated C-terminal domain-containing protein [Bacteroidales bacterium]|nr:gliding motility-associated C-terminal domain-containing protein [Bacteroidales bacterium]
MKIFSTIILTLLIWFSSHQVNAQCFANILTPLSDTTICVGDSVFISAFATCNFLMNNNFDNGTVGTGWSSNASPMFNNPCGPGLPGSGIHCWIGSATNFPRELVTINFNLFSGCYIEWEMRYAADENSTNCEDPDQPNEGVHLQYSLAPYTVWTDINYWTPNTSYTGPLYSWAQYSEVVPAVAFGPNTKIRWYQDLTSGNTWDHWGIDEVEIVCPQSQNIFWSNGLTDSLNQWVSPVTTTEYIIAIFDTLGNLATDTVTINVVPSPDADFSTISPVCIGQNSDISLVNTADPNVTYTWDFDGGVVASGSGGGPYQVNWPTLGTYTITLTATEGACESVQTQTVVVNSDITVNISPVAPFVCTDSAINLTASGGSLYAWAPSGTLSSDSGTTVTATPSGQTTYTVTGTSPEGCTGSASVTVQIYPDPIIEVTPVPSEGCEPVIVNFTSTITPGGSSYDWNFGDPASGTYNTSTNANPQHVYALPGSYDITLNVISSDGCPASETFVNMINVYENPIAGFMADPITANMSNPIINFSDQSINGFTWYWDFGEIGSPGNYSSVQNPSHTYSDEGTYYVWQIVTTEHGCSDSAFMVVYVERDIAFYVPNAFSPHNNDGINDVFRPYGIGINNESGYFMKIFDRWGKTVFETTDMEYGWDGTINNEKALHGLYSYYIEVQFSDGLWHKFYGKVVLVE